MPRSPPPQAIAAIMTPLSAVTEGGRSSDLPLRNYLALEDHFNSDSTTRSTTVSQSTSSIPDTPSSVTAEFGDHSKRAIRPVECILQATSFQSHPRSRSQSGGSRRHMPQASTQSSNPTSGTQQSRSRSHSLPRKDTTLRSTMAPTEKVNRFLHSIAQSPTFSATEELLTENRTLQQRIAALQRTEESLLEDIQDLSRNLASSQQRYETRRQRWKDELRNRERSYEARIKELESKVAQQDNEIKLLNILNKSRDNSAGVSNEEVSSWFTTRATAWRSWAQKHVHHDPNRVQSGLHPLQLRELCEGVKHFVRLPEDDKLPKQLLLENNGMPTAHLLLNGMLSNFIVSEIFESPFWIFDVIAADKLELESPSVPQQNSMSPVGFRMDLAMWNNSTIAPPRNARLAPHPVMNAVATQKITKGLPKLVTSMQPPSGAAKGLLDQEFPSRQQMEGLYYLLCNVSGGTENAQIWRARLVKSLSDIGFSAVAGDTNPQNELTIRLLVGLRKQYAARLKDRFLHGAARFLLQDQDAKGIEKLERELVYEIDSALRFACQLWSSPHVSPRVKGLTSLADRAFTSSDDRMELCQSQAPVLEAQNRRANSGEVADAPPGYHDGDEVLVVVQPAVETLFTSDTKGEKTVVWSKAQVLVAASSITPQSRYVQQPVPEPRTAILSNTPPLLHSKFYSAGHPKPQGAQIKKEREVIRDSAMSAEILLGIAFNDLDTKRILQAEKPLPEVPNMMNDKEFVVQPLVVRSRKGSAGWLAPTGEVKAGMRTGR